MKMLKDKKIIALILILGVFSIGYFVIANKISYAFESDYNATQAYDSTIKTIKSSAIAYGKANLETIKKSDNKTIYPKVQDLIDNGFLVPNADGLIINPIKTSESLNGNMIKIKYEKEDFIVEIDN